MESNQFSHCVFSDGAGKKLLKQLSKINRPLEIKFNEMLNLMNQCDIVEKQNVKRNERRNAKPSDEDSSTAFQFKNNPFSVFSGIIPGTKWCVCVYIILAFKFIGRMQSIFSNFHLSNRCGTGDIAATYSDLGE